MSKITDVNVEAGREAIASLLSKPLLRLVGTPKPKTGIVGSECQVKAVDHQEEAAVYTARSDNYLWAGTKVFNEEAKCVVKTLGMDWFQENMNRTTDLLNEVIPEDLTPYIADSAFERIDGFEQAVLKKVRYDLRSIGSSHVYASIMPIVYFRDYIEPWYRAGYFPCNWASVPRKEEVSQLLAKAKVLVY